MSGRLVLVFVGTSVRGGAAWNRRFEREEFGRESWKQELETTFVALVNRKSLKE